MLFKHCFVVLLLLAVLVSAANKDEWKKRSIYQVLTDRFARNDGTTPTCSNLGKNKLT
jgi:alpha-amylase